MTKLHGVIPPVTTPFTEADAIDHQAVRRQVDWMVDSGVHGIAVGGSTGEGHTLDLDEFTDLIRSAVDAAAGRVPVVAGIIVDSTRDAVRRGKAVADLGVEALQITPVHYLFRPDDAAMKEHFRVVGEETGKPVIIYNVVPWSYLSPALLLEIMRDVPNVVGVKQSAGDLKLFADLMADARPEDEIYSAVDALMYPSYALGARGSIAAILSAAPRASVALWDAVRDGDHATAKTLHLQLLRLWNAMIDDNLPAAVKYAQTLQGCPAGVPRPPMPAATEAQRAGIRAALQGLGAVAAEAAE